MAAKPRVISAINLPRNILQSQCCPIFPEIHPYVGNVPILGSPTGVPRDIPILRYFFPCKKLHRYIFVGTPSVSCVVLLLEVAQFSVIQPSLKLHPSYTIFLPNIALVQGTGRILRIFSAIRSILNPTQSECLSRNFSQGKINRQKG